MPSMITRQVIEFARTEFRLEWNGIHGAPHWSRVRHNGLLLAQLTGANTRVIEYFAFLHDLGRENDYHDPEHGCRAADIAENIAGDLISVTGEELALLMTACRGHSDGHLVADVTVMTCWDADRLDLARVGIEPRPARLCTQPARARDFLEAAVRRSLERRVAKER